ncbi:MAG: hypothetical protein AB1762_15540 [Gemmatimonadota bacterium]
MDASSSKDSHAEQDDLQFDRAVPAGSNGGTAHAMVCSSCANTLRTWYFDVNGEHVCTACKGKVARMSGPLREWGPTLTAGLFGLGAAIAGAAIYYGVIAITEFEIGIVALLIGYMVGFALRKGAGGRGGRRLQVLGALLTYFAVAMAYVPLAVKAATDNAFQADSTAISADSLADAADGDEESSALASAESLSVAPNVAVPAIAVNPVLSLGLALAFALALPLMVVFGTLPSGLISALIIGIGMRQAWVMTRAAEITIAGPFKVGAKAGDGTGASAASAA